MPVIALQLLLLLLTNYYMYLIFSIAKISLLSSGKNKTRPTTANLGYASQRSGYDTKPRDAHPSVQVQSARWPGQTAQKDVQGASRTTATKRTDNQEYKHKICTCSRNQKERHLFYFLIICKIFITNKYLIKSANGGTIYFMLLINYK